jgi:hypothetical protein
MPEQPKAIGKYSIVRTLGRGAMGMVYEGFDPVIERKVAIKTILADYLDAAEMEDATARFKREAQAGGRLQHPNIVGVYEYGGDGAMAFIVMEVRGGPGAEEAARHRQALRADRDLRAHEAAAGRARLLAQGGRGPPRHQARQPDRPARAEAEGDGLRHRAPRVVEPHADRHRHRHAPRTCRRSSSWATRPTGEATSGVAA